jgi:hypothetical protein
MPRAVELESNTPQRTTTDDEEGAGPVQATGAFLVERENMAKPLRHTKSGTTEGQRLLCHHIDQALKALQGNQPLSDAAVHSVRKQLKKGRADLRLLRKALGSHTCVGYSCFFFATVGLRSRKHALGTSAVGNA